MQRCSINYMLWFQAAMVVITVTILYFSAIALSEKSRRLQDLRHQNMPSHDL
jgi:HAMP domain-containing protein